MAHRLAMLGLLLAGLLAARGALALNLLQAYQEALAADPTFLAARANNAAASEQVPQALGNLLPAISISASRFDSNTLSTTETILGPRASESDYISRNESLTLRQPLLRLDRIAQYRQAGAQVSAAEATLEHERQNLALRTASAYIEVLVALEAIDLVAAQKEAYAGQLARAERAFAVGAGTRTDIDEARARHDTATAQEFDSKNRLAQAERALGLLLGRSVRAGQLDKLVPARLPLDTRALPAYAEWLQRGEQYNPEFAAATHAVTAAEHDLDRARAGHLPTLDLVAQKVRSQSDSVTAIGSHYDTRQIGVQLSVPLYAGGQTQSAVRQAVAILERTRQSREGLQRQLAINVGKEFDQVMQGAPKIAAFEQSLASTAQALVSAKKGLQAGTRNTVDVLNAQQQELAARVELVRARYEFIGSWLKLHALVGNLAEATLAESSRWLGAGAP